MFGVGMGELIVIFLVIFLLFGPNALPEMARNIAKAIKMFQSQAQAIKDEIALLDKEDKPTSQATPPQVKGPSDHEVRP